MKDSEAIDTSGNVRLNDIGVFLKEKIGEYFKTKKVDINLKYIDPSYMIRSAPANSNDSVYCTKLGAYAVHAAMAGKTGLIVSLIEATGQPLLIKERRTKPRTKKIKKSLNKKTF